MLDTLDALSEDELKLAKALAKAADIPNVKGQWFTLAHRDRLLSIIGQARVLVACQSVGVTSDDGRHELIHGATGESTSSSKDLTAEQVAAVLAYCAELAAADEATA